MGLVGPTKKQLGELSYEFASAKNNQEKGVRWAREYEL